MSTETTQPQRFADPEAQRYDEYRTLSFSAIVTFIFGLISIPLGIFATQNAFLLIIPLIGALFGAYTVLKLRRRQEEFTGYGIARFGWLTSLILFIGGAAFVGYTYATEVPEGFERISFRDLQPDPKYPDFPVPPAAATLNGQKIFVKGYVFPDDQLGEIKRFILVPDFGACCFGKTPKLTDMMQITLDDPDRVRYSYFLRSIAGTFRLQQGNANKVGEVVYHVDEGRVRK